jgi:hypothetical protein
MDIEKYREFNSLLTIEKLMELHGITGSQRISLATALRVKRLDMMIEGFEKGEPSGVIAKKVYRAIRTVQDWRKKFYKKGIQKPPSEK